MGPQPQHWVLHICIKYKKSNLKDFVQFVNEATYVYCQPFIQTIPSRLFWFLDFGVTYKWAALASPSHIIGDCLALGSLRTCVLGSPLEHPMEPAIMAISSSTCRSSHRSVQIRLNAARCLSTKALQRDTACSTNGDWQQPHSTWPN